MTDDLMIRARQALADEESARLLAKAEELASGDERARLEDAQKAKQAHARETAAVALNTKGITLPDLARQFDAAVTALVELAQAADRRNRTIEQQAVLMAAADAPEAQGRGGGSVVLGDEIHSIRDAKPTELLARALAVAASEVGTRDNGGSSLVTSLLAYSGPLARLTAVERAQR
ncbi:hypothetical protein [Streptomyces sp. VNUA24]|uniref:hypothetical protein n=1 Tax=Streptomyces sp. VNUA24 TaxID=3031131 RepID=UPI0023B7C9AE|nr:hypothetical protein [Streptomyces sp. VNUA24]WEH15016.1 hypothetical protein PYR72_15300 [Streptomyces sp. VNUA24]